MVVASCRKQLVSPNSFCSVGQAQLLTKSSAPSCLAVFFSPNKKERKKHSEEQVAAAPSANTTSVNGEGTAIVDTTTF